MTYRPGLTLPATIFSLCIFFQTAHAVTITASSCSSSSVQAAINSAGNGDTVTVPGGNCTWSSAINIPSSKGVTLNGGGNTTIAGQITLSSSSATGSRITGFVFTTGSKTIKTNGSKDSAEFRIDNNTFNAPGTQSTFIESSGNAPGLIDHNTFVGAAASEMIHNLGAGPTSTAGWTSSVTPGSPDMLYIEDNSFTYNASGSPAYFWGTSAVQSYYGARTVFRYNKLKMVHVDQHGTPGMIGARWWEIYENTFDTNVSNANQCCYVTVRAGSGVIFNNRHVGANQSNGSIELTEEDSGYPALYQIGRGTNQVVDPAYVWNNATDMKVRSGSSNVVVNRDYYLTAKPYYAAFKYPYPLNSNGLPDPAGSSGTSNKPVPPTNLTVLISSITSAVQILPEVNGL